jgi:hypothetical protein
MPNQGGDPNAIDVPTDLVGATVQGFVNSGAQRISVEQKDPATFRIRVLA